MSSNIFRQLLPVLSLLAMAHFSTSTALAEAGYDAGKEVATPSEQMDFQNINPAIKMANAYGDKFKSAHGTFGQFPAHFVTPMHTHSGAYHGVVIRGVMTNPFKGEDQPPSMGPGSYWHVPAGSVHATACISNAPCEFYFHADSPFDFRPVE